MRAAGVIVWIVGRVGVVEVTKAPCTRGPRGVLSGQPVRFRACCSTRRQGWQRKQPEKSCLEAEWTEASGGVAGSIKGGVSQMESKQAYSIGSPRCKAAVHEFVACKHVFGHTYVVDGVQVVLA
jgi:hypothetical protein